MKNLRFILALAVAAFVAAAVQAEDKKDANAPESKTAKCCAKAEAKGEKCSHECCAEAAKTGDNCAKCGGSGKVEPKK